MINQYLPQVIDIGERPLASYPELFHNPHYLPGIVPFPDDKRG
jgi:hypothetical protein